jgi:hypothetical protein
MTTTVAMMTGSTQYSHILCDPTLANEARNRSSHQSLVHPETPPLNFETFISSSPKINPIAIASYANNPQWAGFTMQGILK